MRVLIILLLILSSITGCSSQKEKEEELIVDVEKEQEEKMPDTKEIKLKSYEYEEVLVAGLKIGSTNYYDPFPTVEHFEELD